MIVVSILIIIPVCNICDPNIFLLQGLSYEAARDLMSSDPLAFKERVQDSLRRQVCVCVCVCVRERERESG